MINSIIIEVPIIPIIIFLACSIVFLLYLIIYFTIRGIKIKRVKTSSLYQSFVFLMILLTLWGIGQLFELIYGKQESGFIYTVEYFAVCFSAFSWLVFCINFAGLNFRINKTRVFFLAIPPIISYTSVLTNHYLSWFTFSENGFRMYGPLFWFHAFFFAIYTFIGFILITKHYYTKISSRIHSILLFISFLIPVIFCCTKVLGIMTFNVVGNKFIREDFDISSASLFITVLIITIGFFRFRLLNIIPTAYREVFNNITEAAAVINEKGIIQMKNQAFMLMFPTDEKLKSGKELFEQYLYKVSTSNANRQKIINNLNNKLHNTFKIQVSIYNTKIEYYEMHIKPLIFSDECIGKIITFNNVTSYQKLLNEYDNKIIQLLNKNEKLKQLNKKNGQMNAKLIDYSQKVEELAMIKEREFLLNEMKDTLGLSIVKVIDLLKTAEKSIYNGRNYSEDLIETAAVCARESLNDFRCSLRSMMYQNKAHNLYMLLEKLIVEFEELGLCIELSIDKSLNHVNSDYSYLIYRICHEWILSSYTYRKVDIVDVVLKHKSNNVLICVFDNGIIKRLEMENSFSPETTTAIKSFNGYIDFTSSKDIGSCLNITLPFI